MEIDPNVTVAHGNDVIRNRPVFQTEPPGTPAATKRILRTVPKPPPSYPAGIKVALDDREDNPSSCGGTGVLPSLGNPRWIQG
jgi:hypothetical protein